jgi:hypothetical protein
VGISPNDVLGFVLFEVLAATVIVILFCRSITSLHKDKIP